MFRILYRTSHCHEPVNRIETSTETLVISLEKKKKREQLKKRRRSSSEIEGRLKHTSTWRLEIRGIESSCQILLLPQENRIIWQKSQDNHEDPQNRPNMPGLYHASSSRRLSSLSSAVSSLFLSLSTDSFARDSSVGATTDLFTKGWKEWKIRSQWKKDSMPWTPRVNNGYLL